MSRERLEVFFDAVLAIVMTLLVLELHVPEIPDGSSFGQFAAALAPSVPKFVSFILSFAMLAIHWVGHHFFFRHVERVTFTLVWLNVVLLLWLCLLPFPTALLGDHPTDSFPVFLYAADSLLAAVTFMAIRAYCGRAGLFKEGVLARDLGPSHSLPAVALYSVAVAGAFVHAAISLVCFVLVPLLYFGQPSCTGIARSEWCRPIGETVKLFKNPQLIILLSVGLLLVLVAGLNAQTNTTPMTTEQRLQLIEDKLALKELVDTFSNLADKKDVKAQVQLFTPDATVTPTSMEPSLPSSRAVSNWRKRSGPISRTSKPSIT